MYQPSTPDDAEQQIAEAIAAEYDSLSQECRANPAKLERLLAADFHEFGASGREFVFAGIAALVAAATDIEAEPIAVDGIRGSLVADRIVMVKYTSSHLARRAHRTSLWRRVGPKEWQMFHHQGTLTDQ